MAQSTPFYAAFAPLVLALVPGVAFGRPPVAQPPAPPAAAVLVAAGDAELAAAVAESWFVRWVAPRTGAKVEIGPAAAGSVRIAAARWPLAEPLRELLAGLPLTAVGGDPALAGTVYPEREVALAVRRPGAVAGEPGWVVTGRRPEAVADLVGEVLALELGGGRGRRGRPVEPFDALVRENPWLERRARLTRSAGGWTVDPAGDRDGFADRRRWFAGLRPVVRSVARPRVRLLAADGAPAADLARLADLLDRAAGEMAARIPLPPEAFSRPVTVAVEADFPAQARHTGRLGAAVAGGPADLHLVLHPDDGFAYRHALALHLLERAREAGALPGLPPALARGAALWLSGEWFGRRWRDWLGDLAAIAALPTAAELLAAADPEDGSAVLSTPAAAALVDALAGDTLAAKLARVPGAPAMAALLARLGQAAARPGPPAPPERVARDAARPRFLRGVSFAMLNSLDGGYHAPSVDGQLARLAGLGADAVSVMPFAYQAAPDRPGLSFMNRHPTSETDAGAIHAARRAQAAGFAVLWKPHLWISWDHWPGDVAMTSEADWRAWWAGYRRYVLHHAVLAAWSGSELFSVGVELTGTEGREAEWRRLIADVRRLYPGRVTYASNWHGGLDGVGFWDALDLIGVDAYYPLAESARATPAQLAEGARRAVATLAAAARTHGKPVLLTEVGFAARSAAWARPHEEGGEYSEADQAAAYRALLGALGRPSWLAGAFVWKAFSGTTGAGPSPDFRFLDRQAEAEVAAWFRNTGGVKAR